MAPLVAWDLLTPLDGSMATYSWKLRHFTKITKPDAETTILLLMDNHDSNLDVRVIEQSQKFFWHFWHFRLIVRIKDVLSPFKNALKRRFNEWLQLHCCQRISIYEVAPLSRAPFLETFSASNIVSVFWATGIFPFDRVIFPEGAFAPSLVTNRLLDTTTVLPSSLSKADSESFPSPASPWFCI